MEERVIDDRIIEYFQNTYVGRTTTELHAPDDGLKKIFRKRFVSGTFSIPFWNVYDRVMEDIRRTNNSIEAWHLHLR